MSRDFTKAGPLKKTPHPRSQDLHLVFKDQEKIEPPWGCSWGLLERFPLAVFILQQGRMVYGNARLSLLLGYESPSSLIGRSFWELVHPEDKEKIRFSTASRGDRDNGPGLVVFRLLHQKGDSLWVGGQGSLISFNGKPALIGTLLDLTPLKEKEIFLQNELERYQTIINEVEDAVAEVDLEGNITFTNEGGCRIWGHTREEALGANYRAYMPDEETAEKVYQAYNQVFKTGRPGKNIVYEIIRKKDGQRRTVEDYVTLIRTPEGKIRGFRVVSRDITDRKKTENQLAEYRLRLEGLFSSTQDAIILVDPDLKVIDVNRPTEQLCGAKANKSSGMTLHNLSLSCNRRCLEALKKTIEHRSPLTDLRIECGHPQRPLQTVNVTTSPLIDPEGRLFGAMMVIRDLTLVRNLKMELRERFHFHHLIGRSPRMQDLYRLLEDLADLDTTVLITGESGTGKELVAKALHYSGRRALQPFVTVNCSALTETLLESELFGHVKGAFTGAIRNKMGRFQAANGGTILLDEIGDISPLIQLKLLRVLQEKVIERVGESTPQKVDVRVIACTNKDLKEKVKKGEFRLDLYYRLKVVEIDLPPLRERQEDLPLLTDHFLHLFNKKFNKAIKGVDDAVLEKFMHYPWPGNVRELEHVMEHAFVLCKGDTITLEHLPHEMRDYILLPKTVPLKGKRPESIRPQMLQEVLQKTDGNKAKAARILGISRKTLYRLMERHAHIST